jgi:hypothetical protein
MKRVRVDTSRIVDWATFHEEFARLFGFFEGYGRNMDAWIDCMSSIGEVGLTTFEAQDGEPILLEVTDPEGFRQRCPAQFEALVDCSAFVNKRCVDRGGPILCLVFVADGES